jgi:hypothetical protein
MQRFTGGVFQPLPLALPVAAALAVFPLENPPERPQPRARQTAASSCVKPRCYSKECIGRHHFSFCFERVGPKVRALCLLLFD